MPPCRDNTVRVRRPHARIRLAAVLFVGLAALPALAGPLTRQQRPSSRYTALTITELMYHPAGRTDGLDLEFIELFNTAPVDCNVGGYQITGSIDFAIPTQTVLRAWSYLVIARDPSAVRSVYGITNVLGPFTNSLPNNRGTVRLRNAAGALLLDVEYADSDPWPVAADGAGHSLALLRPDFGEGFARAWGPSRYAGGSPGAMDPQEADPLDAVTINEFLANTDPPQVDYIELFNAGTQAVDLSLCTLSDAADTNRFTIPPGTWLPPRGFVCVVESNEQAVAWPVVTTTNLGFSLSSRGDEIFFRNAAGTRVVDAVRFGAQANGVACGRHPDGAPAFAALAAITPGTSNAPPRAPEVVINELMFHPISESDADEYVELFNPGTSRVDLSAWRFTDGIGFVFPTGTLLEAGDYLVVARDATNLLARYPQLHATNTLGNYTGSLSDRGERIALARPDDPAFPDENFVIVDEVTYADGWAEWTDGGGSSLELRDARTDKQLAVNWAASDESAKAPWTLVDYTDSLDHGVGGTDPLNIWSASSGEYAVDDLRVSVGATVSLAEDFESGGAGWFFGGGNLRSTVEGGVGYGGSAGLYVRASQRGECGGYDGRFVNYIARPMSLAPAPGQVARIQAKVRWLRGYPYLFIGTRGYWIATPGDLTVPKNLGTPGARNSAATNNAGPAIVDVAHSPILPPAGSNVLLTCRVVDPDGIAGVNLKHRVDPSSTLATLAMRDDGTGGDRLAGDGVYSATLPGQASGKLVAFSIEAADGASPPATSRFPSRVVPKRPASEGLIAWGLPPSKGDGGIPTYRALLTQENANRLDANRYSREPVDGTCVYDDIRAIYGAEIRNHSGYYHSGYWFALYQGDLLLGTDQLLMQTSSASKILNYTYVPWALVELGLPAGLMRPVVFARNAGSLALIADHVQPSRELCSLWFDDPNPEVFKNQDIIHDAFGVYTNQFGDLKKSVYAGLSNKRIMRPPNDDYEQVFKIVRAVSAANDAQYIPRVRAVIDLESWASYFSIEPLFGDLDHYGYIYMHNYYVYIPPTDTSRLLLVDTDGFSYFAVLVRWPDHLIPKRMFTDTPAFKRIYWAMLKDAAEGPLLPERSNPLIDAWYDAFTNNELTHENPNNLKQDVADARAAVLSGLAGVAAPFDITSNGGADFSTTNRIVTLSGRAPVEVMELRVNGQKPSRVDYPTLTTWSIRLGLNPGPQTLIVEGFDRHGRLVGSDSITVTSTAPAVAPEGLVVISEIMYAPPVSQGGYVEMFNRSAQHAFDLGGWRLKGADFTFPPGAVIEPRGFLVVADNLAVYQWRYGNAEVVAGTYGGTLAADGETLRLEKPAGSNAWSTVDAVRYAPLAPWPAAAAGEGASLQRVDLDQDGLHPGNWAAVEPYLMAWQSVEITGKTSGRGVSNAQVHVYLESAGQAFVDNLRLVAGTNAAAGTNLLTNGDFEQPLSVGWVADGSHSGSRVSTNAPDTGEGSLLVLASGPGGNTGNSVHQGNLNLAPNTNYTLSFRYLPQPGPNTALVAEVTYSTIRSVQNSQAPAASIPLVTPGASNSTSALLPALPALWINEVMPSNTVMTNVLGQYAPWIELYNAGTGTVDLSACALSDDYAHLELWSFPTGSILEAGQRLLVWADGQTNATTPSELHASFALNPLAGQVALSLRADTRTILLDYVDYSQLPPGTSYGSYPEGNPLNGRILEFPSPGAPNVSAAAPLSVRINEWMASNTLIPDPVDGRKRDWFELHNPDRETAWLAGCRLATGANGSNRTTTIAGDVSIPAGGYLLVWADRNWTNTGTFADLHVPFNLSASGDDIWLFARDGALIDHVAFGQQIQNVSEGRWPNGSDSVYAMPLFTPGAPNRLFAIGHLAAEPAANPAEVGWTSGSGRVYRLDFKNELSESNWAPLGLVTARADYTILTDTNAGSAPARFYRVADTLP